VLDIVEFAPPLDEDERTLASCVELLEAALPEPPA
jgi:arginase family enzyme